LPGGESELLLPNQDTLVQGTGSSLTVGEATTVKGAGVMIGTGTEVGTAAMIDMIEGPQGIKNQPIFAFEVFV